jgi:hypothetical protein
LAQASRFDCHAKHDIGHELAMMCDILDRAGPIEVVEAEVVSCGGIRRD